jgi:L-lysine exporter family protein LysE/ArgO
MNTALAAAEGFALGASLIIAIGAQNAFVLRQGLARAQVFLVAGLCSLADAALIALGAGAFAALVAALPALAAAAAWGGALFLLAYGARALLGALRPGRLEAGGGAVRGAWKAAALTLAVSLLNPIGSVAAQLAPAERLAFALGAMAASFAWFFGLALGARRLAPLFARPIAWRLLDLAIAGVMWSIAGALIVDQLAG